MKKLFVVRHAKSSWDNPQLEDFDRPLNKRGKNAAPLMGKRLAKRGIMPDLLISSPAKRAYATAKLIAKEINYPKEDIHKESKLYEANVDGFISVLKSVEDEVEVLMIFSHNPGLTDFTNFVADTVIYNVPTCGIAELQLEVDSWKQIAENTCKFISFDFPKKKDNSI